MRLQWKGIINLLTTSLPASAGKVLAFCTGFWHVDARTLRNFRNKQFILPHKLRFA